VLDTGIDFFRVVLRGLLFGSGIPAQESCLFGFLYKAAVEIDEDFREVEMVVTDFDGFALEERGDFELEAEEGDEADFVNMTFFPPEKDVL